jgi:hypothetical protein
VLPKEAQSGQPAATKNIVDRFVELAQPMKQTALARLWTNEEANWQCQQRVGSVVAALEFGSRRGMLVAYIIPVANAARTKCLMIEDVLWGNLAPQEREILVKALLDRGASAGAQLAVVPVLGYADLEPFYSMRFRPSQRIQHAYLTLWNGDPIADDLPSMYLDVF